MKVYVKVLKTREQFLKDIIIEDLREQLEKATIDYQAVIAENKMLREQLNGSNNDSDISSLDELEAITKARTREEELIDELEATKMMLSTLRKEHDMLQKQYDGLKKTHEKIKDENATFSYEIGQNIARLYEQLHEKTTDYNVLRSKYDYLEAEFNKFCNMDKIQKFITDIKGEATEKKGDKEQ